jgi:hypothetical protein
MAAREITVRITAEGRIVFDLTGMSQEEIRLMRVLAEETLGRIVGEGAPQEPPPPGKVLTGDSEQERTRGRG